MKHCQCHQPHQNRRIVLTGGPGAGKTAVLELVRHALCEHTAILPEAAGILFGGGFPRHPSPEARRAAQRAIFYVQRELEVATQATDAAISLCDRGTVDSLAYWPGPEDFWICVGTTLDEQLARYDAVIHLRTPPAHNGYNHQNPIRIESAEEAAAIDQRIAAAWAAHPRRYEIEPAPDFLTKASQVIRILWSEMPACCRGHLIPALDRVLPQNHLNLRGGA